MTRGFVLQICNLFFFRPCEMLVALVCHFLSWIVHSALQFGLYALAVSPKYKAFPCVCMFVLHREYVVRALRRHMLQQMTSVVSLQTTYLSVATEKMSFVAAEDASYLATEDITSFSLLL